MKTLLLGWLFHIDCIVIFSGCFGCFYTFCVKVECLTKKKNQCHLFLEIKGPVLCNCLAPMQVARPTVSCLEVASMAAHQQDAACAPLPLL